jgi:hypothetical protein
MFGQWFSGIVTLITVWFLWKQTQNSQKQTDASLKQTQLAIEQMEEARRREKEARQKELNDMIPDLSFSCSVEFEQFHKICLYLTNIKRVPLRIYACKIHQIKYISHLDSIHTPHNPKLDVEQDIHKTMQYGDVSLLKIQLFELIKELRESERQQGIKLESTIFVIEVLSTIEKVFEYTILLTSTYVELGGFWWSVYLTNGVVGDESELETDQNFVFEIQANDSFNQLWEDWYLEKKIQNPN